MCKPPTFFHNSPHHIPTHFPPLPHNFHTHPINCSTPSPISTPHPRHLPIPQHTSTFLTPYIFPPYLTQLLKLTKIPQFPHHPYSPKFSYSPFLPDPFSYSPILTQSSIQYQNFSHCSFIAKFSLAIKYTRNSL